MRDEIGDERDGGRNGCQCKDDSVGSLADAAHGGWTQRGEAGMQRAEERDVRGHVEMRLVLGGEQGEHWLVEMARVLVGENDRYGYGGQHEQRGGLEGGLRGWR